VKKVFPIFLFVLMLTGFSVIATFAQGGKYKVENNTSPVWKALEDYYSKSAKVVLARDVEAALKMRELLTVETPDGKIHDSAEFAEATKAMFKLNPQILGVSNKILSLTTEGNEAVAVVFQEFSRMQNLAGKLRRVDSSVIQTEIFTKTAEGWKIRYVYDIHGQKRFVDGKRIDPTKPFNPNDPPFNPDNDEPEK